MRIVTPWAPVGTKKLPCIHKELSVSESVKISCIDILGLCDQTSTSDTHGGMEGDCEHKHTR